MPREGDPKLLIHHVDAGNIARLGVEVVPYGGREEMLSQLEALLRTGASTDGVSFPSGYAEVDELLRQRISSTL